MSHYTRGSNRQKLNCGIFFVRIYYHFQFVFNKNAKRNVNVFFPSYCCFQITKKTLTIAVERGKWCDWVKMLDKRMALLVFTEHLFHNLQHKKLQSQQWFHKIPKIKVETIVSFVFQTVKDLKDREISHTSTWMVLVTNFDWISRMSHVKH